MRESQGARPASLSPQSLHGLYVLTDPDLIPDAELVGRVRQAIEGGAGAVQYRDKRPGYRDHLKRAHALRTVTRQLDALFIVNDDPQLALDVDADGVHLGRDDPDITEARHLLGKRLIGISCYNDFQRAVAASKQGADYVAFGSFYPTTTKFDTVIAAPDLLRRAKRELQQLTVVAIGGITPENGATLIAAGADSLAVVSAVFAATDPRRAAQRFEQVFKQ